MLLKISDQYIFFQFSDTKNFQYIHSVIIEEIKSEHLRKYCTIVSLQNLFNDRPSHRLVYINLLGVWPKDIIIGEVLALGCGRRLLLNANFSPFCINIRHRKTALFLFRIIHRPEIEAMTVNGKCVRPGLRQVFKLGHFTVT